MSGFEDIKNEVYKTAVSLWKEGMLSASSGNVSARVPGTELAAITPSGIRYDRLKPEEIVMIDLYGNVQEGEGIPSSETPMHTLIYREKPDVNAVIHTHSPYAIVFASLGESIPMVCIEGLGVGKAVLPVTKHFHVPGTEAFAEEVMGVLSEEPQLRALLLASHGLLTMGKSMAEAQGLSESLELQAKIYHQARLLGMPAIISEAKRQEIVKRYKKPEENREENRNTI